MAAKVLAALAALGLSAVLGYAAAHHSVAGQFDMAKRTTVTGTISKIDWINPHAYVYVDVPDEHGVVTTWQFESLPTAMLRKAGLTSALLKADGGKVTVEGLLARDGTEHLAWLLKITYEDGHFYQLGGE
jgi:hypothetical protein